VLKPVDAWYHVMRPWSMLACCPEWSNTMTKYADQGWFMSGGMYRKKRMLALSRHGCPRALTQSMTLSQCCFKNADLSSQFDSRLQPAARRPSQTACAAVTVQQ
jgi:hypothetical protein